MQVCNCVFESLKCSGNGLVESVEDTEGNIIVIDSKQPKLTIVRHLHIVSKYTHHGVTDDLCTCYIRTERSQSPKSKNIFLIIHVSYIILLCIIIVRTVPRLRHYTYVLHNNLELIYSTLFFTYLGIHVIN